VLTKTRQEQILHMLEEKNSITVTEITQNLGISESTARRDIVTLHKEGKLIKVFGGAVALEENHVHFEPTVAQKIDVNREEKKRIAKYCAEFIEPEDFVYLDAGTTTWYMIEYITEKTATFVTNGVAHAQYLAAAGFQVILLGGELKATTDAVVGGQATFMLGQYHFSKGFFGTNGVTAKAGLTTPDANEALVKRRACERSRKVFVLADASKFDQISSVTFADFEDAIIVTDRKPKGYGKYDNVIHLD